MKSSAFFRGSFLKKMNPPYILLLFMLISAFLLGGGSRADIISLVVLRPLSIIACGIAFWTLSLEQVKAHRPLFIATAMIFLIVVIQLMPLPPQLWQSLPGRAVIIDIDNTAAIVDQWRPLSLAPSETWNAFYSLFTPLSVLLLAVQLEKQDRYNILFIIIAIGIISGLLGMLQILGDSNGPAYLYEITNRGSAVGLFANRNHQAVFLAILFPMLALYASTDSKTPDQQRFRFTLALAIGIFLIPLLLVTGSRAGMLLGVIGIISAAIIYRKPKVILQPKRRARAKNFSGYLLIAFLTIIMAGLTVIAARANAIERLLSKDSTEGLRFATLDIILEKSWEVFPFGTGFGSFADVYRIIEPDNLLGPAYFNHAHNDWLEIFLTGGLPGLLVLGLACAWVLWRTKGAFFDLSQGKPRRRSYARLGAVIAIMLGIASFADYPLRVPSLMCLWVIAVVWIQSAFMQDHERHAPAGLR
ncbi:MAG: O-antigen ligase family protein [Pseudomonadota bacterium]